MRPILSAGPPRDAARGVDDALKATRARLLAGSNAMHVGIGVAIVLAATASALACTRPSPGPGDRGALRLAPAADYLLGAFRRVPLVAFSEPRHAAGGTREFLRALLRSPRFSATVDDVVVEFGNARYQDVADRYVAGEAVPYEELKRIWENTTIVTGVWTASLYEGVLEDIRALNATLPPGERVRVVLGDPPIDWTAVRGPADEDMNDWRDAHFAWVVEEHVMKRGRRALLWFGGAHLSRRVMFPESLIHLLDRRFPEQTLVALALDRRDVDGRVLERLDEWPSLMAAPVRDTWLGRLDAATAAGMRLSTGTVEQNIDVAIFWDAPPGAADEAPRVDPASAYGVELRRRQRLARSTVAFRGGAIRFVAQGVRITAESEPALTAVRAALQRDTALRLLVKGFADAREADGVALSTGRAGAVVDWLVRRGVAASRLEPRGCGAARALWVGQSEPQRAANRRAELVRHSASAACTPPTSFPVR
jgi:outer membrane protein OmpA-like peptidoglycan-associated protein